VVFQGNAPQAQARQLVDEVSREPLWILSNEYYVRIHFFVLKSLLDHSISNFNLFLE